MTTPTTTQSPTWKSLTSGNHASVSDGDLMQAYAEVNTTIHGLERMYGHEHQMWDLTSLANKISQIQSDRQAAKRPEGWLMMCDMDDGSITYDTIGGRWTAGPNEQTAELRKQLEAVYETTTMVER